MNAYEDLLEYLEDGEVVEGIVFGAFGEKEQEPPPVPVDRRGVVLTLEEAKPFMMDWSFHTDYGAAECYAAYIWTNMRLIWITQIDGAAGLDSAPRNPVNIVPYMFGR